MTDFTWDISFQPTGTFASLQQTFKVPASATKGICANSACGNRRRVNWRSIIAMTALGVALGAASNASAETIFSATGPLSLTTTTDTSPVTVMQTGTSASTGETYQGTANSSQGHLGTFITTTGGSTIQGAFASSLASFTTDVIFSPTAGSTSTTIDVSLNLNIAGSLSGATNTGLGWTIFGGGGAGGFSFSMNSAVLPGGNPSNPLPPSHSETNIAYTSGGETLSTFSDTVNATATTALFTVGVGVPVPININLRVDGVATLGATGSADFLNSLDFPLTNIFNLPDGFTVNDPDMFILNNNFVPPVAGVPEPSTWAMLLLGFAALGYMGLRQSRVRAIVA
jgi:PEP-CTERM motif